MPHTRVELAEVKEIFETTLTEVQIRPFLLVANRIVEDNLVGLVYVKPDGTSGVIDPDTLKEIERWIAAHAAAMWDKRVKEDGVGTGKFKYEGETGKHLEFTRYGQMAMDLDPTGKLRAIGGTEAKPPFLYSATAGTPKEVDAPEGQLA